MVIQYWLNSSSAGFCIHDFSCGSYHHKVCLGDFNFSKIALLLVSIKKIPTPSVVIFYDSLISSFYMISAQKIKSIWKSCMTL